MVGVLCGGCVLNRCLDCRCSLVLFLGGLLFNDNGATAIIYKVVG